jgi:DNA polymerase III epsilon subunit-like protein
MQDNRFLYLDTETTDTQAKDLMQLAFVTDNPNIKLNLFFKPKIDISFGAMAVHHITPEMVADKHYFENTPLPKENIHPEYKGDDLVEYLKFLAEKYIWVAHNAEFDLEVLGKKGIEIPKYICTLKVARNALTEGNRDLESYRLQFLRYYLGLYKDEDKDHITAHDALSDVYFLRDLFHYLLNNTKLSAQQMMIISKQPQIIREVRFGKYSGKTLQEIARLDREYLIWIVENMTDKEDLVWNAKRVLDMDITSNSDGNLTWI